MTDSNRTPPTPGERIAAVAALVSLAAAVVLAVLGAASDWQGLVVTLFGVLLIIAGGWYAVSRRGMVRSVAILVALVGAGLLIAGFFVADLTILRLLAVALVAGISVGAARVALRRSAQARKAEPPPGIPVPPARHAVLLINPKSGGGKGEKFHLDDECRARGIEPIVLAKGDDLLELAEDAIKRGADVIGMAGGDGSQALVATVATRHDVPHVVVPAGTRNHLALDLGLDRDDVVGALDAFGDGLERAIDLATVNGRVFVNNASLGLYAKIVQSPEYRDAKGKTVLDMLPDLLGPDSESLDLRFATPDGRTHPNAQVILVSNNPYELRGLEGVGTRERMDGGVLGVAALHVASAKDVSVFAALQATGQSHRFDGWLEWAPTQFRIDSGTPVEIGLDGEAMKMDPPLVFETMPRALRVRIPRHAPGRSPAAMALHPLSQTTVMALARVVRGRPAG